MRLQAGLTKLTVAAQFTAKEFVSVWHATGLNHRAQASQLLHCSCAAGCLALCDGDMDSQVPPASPRARPLPPLTSPGPPTQAERPGTRTDELCKPSNGQAAGPRHKLQQPDPLLIVHLFNHLRQEHGRRVGSPSPPSPQPGRVWTQSGVVQHTGHMVQPSPLVLHPRG